MCLAAVKNSQQDIRYHWKDTIQMLLFCVYIKPLVHLPPQCCMWFCDLKKDIVELERVHRRISR